MMMKLLILACAEKLETRNFFS